MISMKFTPPKGKIKLRADFTGFHRRAADYMASSTAAKINKGIRPANRPLTVKVKGNNLTLRDRGQLLGSLNARATKDAGIVSVNHRAARIHQEGGEIRPKNAKRLAVPAGARTRQLMRSYGATPRLLIDRLKAAGWNIWTTKKGVVMGKESSRSKPIALFILKTRIKIPKRRFFFFSKEDREIIRTIFRNFTRGE